MNMIYNFFSSGRQAREDSTPETPRNNSNVENTIPEETQIERQVSEVNVEEPDDTMEVQAPAEAPPTKKRRCGRSEKVADEVDSISDQPNNVTANRRRSPKKTTTEKRRKSAETMGNKKEKRVSRSRKSLCSSSKSSLVGVKRGMKRGRVAKVDTQMPGTSTEDNGEEQDAGQPETIADYPIFVLVRQENDKIYDLGPRIPVMCPRFTASVPVSCPEAARGQSLGYCVLNHESFPGIPTKKFAFADWKIHGYDKDDWPVQACYEDKDDKVFVYYEGWDCFTMCSQPLNEAEANAPETVRDMRTRQKFCEAVKSELSEEDLKNFNEYWPETSHLNPRHTFWLFEDMTYFHSAQNKEIGMASIFYMDCTSSSPQVPYYAYSPMNIVNCNAFERCLASKFNLTFAKLAEDIAFGPKDPKNVCEKKETCKCDSRFGLLYAKRFTRSMKYNPDSTVNLENFDMDFNRVLVECSDECGCSFNCPRRCVQRGQQIPLVVYYESSKKGFGLRAAADIKKGSLVCEYTGEMIVLPPSKDDEDEDDKPEDLQQPDDEPSTSIEPSEEVDTIQEDVEDETEEDEEDTEDSRESSPLVIVPPKPSNKSKPRRVVQQHVEGADGTKGKDTSYEAEFAVMDRRLVLCALNKGNVARFINHSCSPNSVFMEVHSRRFEKDPLIPRIAVFAIEDIPLGSEITVAYWTSAQRKEYKDSLVQCQCGSEKCMKTLPSSV